MFIPHKFAFVGSKVGFSSDEILATISVHVDPVSHMVEVAVFVACHCLSLSSFADIIRIHSDDVNSTVALSRNKEAIRYNDGARLIPEDITGDDLDVIRPLEVADVFNLNRFKFAYSVVLYCTFNTRSNPDGSVTERVSSE